MAGGNRLEETNPLRFEGKIASDWDKTGKLQLRSGKSLLPSTAYDNFITSGPKTAGQRKT
jgi:hypothetical protein